MSIGEWDWLRDTGGDEFGFIFYVYLWSTYHEPGTVWISGKLVFTTAL